MPGKLNHLLLLPPITVQETPLDALQGYRPMAIEPRNSIGTAIGLTWPCQVNLSASHAV